MATKSVTAANVQHSTNATLISGPSLLAAEAVTAGAAAYKLAAGTYGLADSSDSEKYKMAGYFAADAAAGQPVVVCTADTDFDPGYTLTAGESSSFGRAGSSPRPVIPLLESIQ